MSQTLKLSFGNAEYKRRGFDGRIELTIHGDTLGGKTHKVVLVMDAFEAGILGAEVRKGIQSVIDSAQQALTNLHGGLK
jgi:hypothetical protein